MHGKGRVVQGGREAGRHLIGSFQVGHTAVTGGVFTGLQQQQMSNLFGSFFRTCKLLLLSGCKDHFNQYNKYCILDKITNPAFK